MPGRGARGPPRCRSPRRRAGTLPCRWRSVALPRKKGGSCGRRWNPRWLPCCEREPMRTAPSPLLGLLRRGREKRLLPYALPRLRRGGRSRCRFLHPAAPAPQGIPAVSCNPECPRGSSGVGRFRSCLLGAFCTWRMSPPQGFRRPNGESVAEKGRFGTGGIRRL